jgi:hypothetical protein
VTVSAAIRLDFVPDMRLIWRTSRYVRDFYGNVLADPDACARVMLAAHEMLENAAKYSTDGQGCLEVEVVERAGQCFVQIRTRNRAAPESLTELRRFFDESGRVADATALYDQMIARTAQRTEGSGLGLARIRAEGEMTLDYSIAGDEVTLVAETAVRLREDIVGNVQGEARARRA